MSVEANFRRAHNNFGAQIAAFVEPGVIASLLGCEEGWCRITIDSHRVTGWMPVSVDDQLHAVRKALA